MKIAIIGAGLSGIAAARTLLSELGDTADITIFEKSRGVGGRMSTRRTDDFEFDHGAQYFTAKDAGFKSVVDAAIGQGLVARWNGTAKYVKEGKLEADLGGARYVSTPRMNSWIKAMAEGLAIKTGAKVSALSSQEAASGKRKWSLAFENGRDANGFDTVIVAVPSPQADALLSPLEFSQIQHIKNTQMDACFAVMVGFDKKIALPWDTVRRGDGPASWISVNSEKPGRPASGTTLMIHAGPDWSSANVDRDKTDLQTEILEDVAEFTGIDFDSASYVTIHRWLYASVSKSVGLDCISDQNLGIIACGDWCLGGRVEGAYLSGKAAAEQLLSAINRA